MFGCIFTISIASAIIPLASSLFTSPLIGPSTIEAISLTTSVKSLPSFAINDGFVVTPHITPISFTFFISSTFAVSKNNFIIYSPF